MNVKDDWVAAAFCDDTLVAELLSRLNQSSSQPPKPPPSLRLPFGWGHRQRRSKPKKDSATATAITRCSPTTPLSWSGGGGAASPSDGDYSNSNSSRPPSDLSRSNKAACLDDYTNALSNKRPKKKKTFAELREEENLLLKERVTLEQELASLQNTIKQQRARSHNLKRIKIDLNLQTAGEICTTSCSTEVAFPNGSNQMEEASSSGHIDSALPRPAHGSFGSMGSSCGDIEVHKGYFAVPDLNMMPSEEEEDIGGPEIVSGTGMS